MPPWYAVLKLVHVLSVVVWIGSAFALSGVTARMLRSPDRATLAAFIPQAGRFGHTIGGPASLLVLVTGIAMVMVGGIGFRPLWVGWGFGGMLAHFIFGAGILRRRNIGLAAAVSAAPADEARIAQAGRSLRTATVAYLVILVSVVAVMVLKPTLGS